MLDAVHMLTPNSDPSLYSFSSKQREIFDGWKRPAEIFNDSGPELYENIMVAKADCDLVQDITTDCSVVASLCAVMRHLKPGKKDSVRLQRVMETSPQKRTTDHHIQATANTDLPL